MHELAKMALETARIVTWYASLPKKPKQCFTPEELTQALNRPLNKLHAPLMTLGWRQDKVWSTSKTDSRRKLRVFYTPPHLKLIRPKRGRPTFYKSFNELKALI
jgi:hypothetical protein